MATGTLPRLSGTMDAAPQAEDKAESLTLAGLAGLSGGLSQAGLLGSLTQAGSLIQPRMGPWAEFLACSFSRPDGITDAKTRLVESSRRFIGNYAVATGALALIFVLGHPSILIGLVLLGAGWVYVIRRSEPVVLMGRELGEKQLYVLMAAVSLLTLLLFGAVEVVVNGLFWGAVCSSMHAVFHEKSGALVYDPLATDVSLSTDSTLEMKDVSLDLEAGTMPKEEGSL